MSTHTPGPLGIHVRYDGYYPRHPVLVTYGEGYPAGTPGRTPEEADKIAHLIAAAPELLEALTEMTKIMVEDGYSNTIVKKARAAIAKAKGETA